MRKNKTSSACSVIFGQSSLIRMAEWRPDSTTDDCFESLTIVGRRETPPRTRGMLVWQSQPLCRWRRWSHLTNRKKAVYAGRGHCAHEAIVCYSHVHTQTNCSIWWLQRILIDVTRLMLVGIGDGRWISRFRLFAVKVKTIISRDLERLSVIEVIGLWTRFDVRKFIYSSEIKRC